MSYLLEFWLLPDSLDALLGRGGLSDVGALDALPLVGSLHHASASGDEFRECLTDLVGETLAAALLVRPGVDPLADEGSYPSFGGLTLTEARQALDQVEARIASTEPFERTDWRTWAFELRRILSDAVDSESDVVTSYG